MNALCIVNNNVSLKLEISGVDNKTGIIISDEATKEWACTYLTPEQLRQLRDWSNTLLGKFDSRNKAVDTISVSADQNEIKINKEVYVFIEDPNSVTCGDCVLSARNDCDKIPCVCHEREDEKTGYFKRKEVD